MKGGVRQTHATIKGKTRRDLIQIVPNELQIIEQTIDTTRQKRKRLTSTWMCSWKLGGGMIRGDGLTASRSTIQHEGRRRKGPKLSGMRERAEESAGGRGEDHADSHKRGFLAEESLSTIQQGVFDRLIKEHQDSWLQIRQKQRKRHRGCGPETEELGHFDRCGGIALGIALGSLQSLARCSLASRSRVIPQPAKVTTYHDRLLSLPPSSLPDCQSQSRSQSALQATNLGRLEAKPRTGRRELSISRSATLSGGDAESNPSAKHRPCAHHAPANTGAPAQSR